MTFSLEQFQIEVNLYWILDYIILDIRNNFLTAKQDETHKKDKSCEARLDKALPGLLYLS